MAGEGHATIQARPDAVWDALLNPDVLHDTIPGAEQVERHAHGAYRATLSFGVGRMRGRYATRLDITNDHKPHALDLEGGSEGRLGKGWARAHVTLSGPDEGPTQITWHYDGGVSGLVSFAGRPVLQLAGHLFVERFFRNFAQRLTHG